MNIFMWTVLIIGILLSIYAIISRRTFYPYLQKEYGEFGTWIYAMMLIPVGNLIMLYPLLIHVDKHIN